jgi:hypothetical protein
VIADGARGQGRTIAGGERIVDKCWISDRGTLIHHGLYRTHQDVALDFLRENEAFKVTQDRNADKLKAESILLVRGFLRCQVYADDGLGLQGTTRAVRAHGATALTLVPRPRRLYFADWPGGRTLIYTGKDLERVLNCWARKRNHAWG